jgi:hypothetical protein
MYLFETSLLHGLVLPVARGISYSRAPLGCLKIDTELDKLRISGGLIFFSFLGLESGTPM